MQTQKMGIVLPLKDLHSLQVPLIQILEAMAVAEVHSLGMIKPCSKTEGTHIQGTAVQSAVLVDVSFQSYRAKRDENLKIPMTFPTVTAQYYRLCFFQEFCNLVRAELPLDCLVQVTLLLLKIN